MSSLTEPYRRMAVRAFGSPGGHIARWDGYWHTYDPDGEYLGSWSTQRRARHAISQAWLREYYRPGRWEACDE